MCPLTVKWQTFQFLAKLIKKVFIGWYFSVSKMSGTTHKRQHCRSEFRIWKVLMVKRWSFQFLMKLRKSPSCLHLRNSWWNRKYQRSTLLLQYSFIHCNIHRNCSNIHPVIVSIIHCRIYSFILTETAHLAIQVENFHPAAQVNILNITNSKK